MIFPIFPLMSYLWFFLWEDEKILPRLLEVAQEQVFPRTGTVWLSSHLSKAPSLDQQLKINQLTLHSQEQPGRNGKKLSEYFWKFQFYPSTKKVQLLAEVKFSCSDQDCPRFSHRLMVLMMLCLKVFGWSWFIKIKARHEPEVVLMKCPFKMRMKSCWHNNVKNCRFGAWLEEKSLSWRKLL